jgi:hypothetical protein
VGWSDEKEPELAVIIVSDGISGETTGDTDPSKSYVGSHIISKIAMRLVLLNAPRILRNDPEQILGANAHKGVFWDQKVRRPLVRKLGELAEDMGGSLTQTILDYFSATLMVGVVCKHGLAIYSIGDGYYIHDRDGYLSANEIGPFPQNKPPAVAYDLVRENTPYGGKDMEHWLGFQQWFYSPIEQVTRFGLASDGLKKIIEAQDLFIPRTTQKVGGIDQFWSDRMFNMKTAMNQRLRQIATSKMEPVLDQVAGGKPIATLKDHPGFLEDDTTLVTGRILRA